MVVDALDCSCACHVDANDAAACACCPASGRWAETCEGRAHTVGGHGKCTPDECREGPRQTRKEWDADHADDDDAGGRP